MNDLIVKIKRIQKALEDAERKITEVLSEQPEQSSEIQDILEYLDTVLLPIVSPDNWNVYSELHDMISMLPSAQPEHDNLHLQREQAYMQGWEDTRRTERQAAIDVLSQYPFEKAVNCISIIEELPSAQSESCEYCVSSLKANGWRGSAKIRYCPMCGRRLTDG